MYALAKEHGARVIAITVPPNQGWKYFQKKAAFFLENTQKTNDFIMGRNGYKNPENVDESIDIYSLLGSKSDPHRLPANQTDDHLHPRGEAQRLIAQEIFQKAFLNASAKDTLGGFSSMLEYPEKN